MTIQQLMLSAGGDSDPYWLNVSLLMHFDGANNGTTFTDSGPIGHTLSRQGTPITSTTQSKFGGASGLFVRANGDTVIAASSGGHTSFLMGTGDFTVEWWQFVENNAFAIAAGVFTTQLPSVPGNYGFSVCMGTNGTTYYSIYIFESFGSPVCAWDGVDAANVNFGAWNHVVVQRASGSYACYMNGINQSPQKTTGVGSESRDYNLQNQVRVGGLFADGSTNQTTNGLSGYIDDLRVTKGIARYSADFTPRTLAFPNG